ncbi:MAG: prepilin-type N-terminal cleavage/methylation domain-containing protein [Lentisphaeraceae bacterium]|nr:prepilin-type N-terminal cleavage/methylation domain-containing protein [Lentisphaeraceae bacterium]
MKKSPTKKKRFTLIELLVVIAIIGILAAILLPAIKSSIEQGKKTDAKAEARQIALALEKLHNDAQSWPDKTKLFTILAGTPTDGYNARGIIYYSGSTKNIFGNTYTIDIDDNEDGQTDLKSISGSVAVYSLGPDNGEITSWD